MKYILIPLIWVLCIPFRAIASFLALVFHLLWDFDNLRAWQRAWEFWEQEVNGNSGIWTLDEFEKGVLVVLAISAGVVAFAFMGTVVLCYFLGVLYGQP